MFQISHCYQKKICKAGKNWLRSISLVFYFSLHKRVKKNLVSANPINPIFHALHPICGSNYWIKTRNNAKKQWWTPCGSGHMARPLLQEHTLKTLISTFFKKREKEPHWLNSNPMWAKLYSNDPQPWRFQGYEQQQLTGLLCFPEAGIPLMQHPPWSPAAGPPGGISWCCGRRNTSVWWNLGGSSRMTPGLEHHWRTAGIRGKATWCSVHHDTKMEKEQPHCAGWLDSPGSQRPRQGNSRAGCHKAHWTQYNR